VKTKNYGNIREEPCEIIAHFSGKGHVEKTEFIVRENKDYPRERQHK